MILLAWFQKDQLVFIDSRKIQRGYQRAFEEGEFRLWLRVHLPSCCQHAQDLSQ